MIEKLKQLPTSLKAVCLIQALLGMLFLFVIFAELAFSISQYENFFALDGYDRVTVYGSLALSIFTILGVLERSQLIRKLLIIFAWIGLLLSLLLLGWNTGYLELTITIFIDVTIIWGLTNAQSKEYFKQSHETKKA